MTQPIKILMVAPTSFFSDYGGHIRILEETLALQARGHTVIIATYFKGQDIAGLDIRRTLPLPYRAEYEVGSSRHKLVFDLYLGLKAIAVALKERPDVIHGHMHEGTLIGWFLARLLRVPLIFDFQGSLTAEMIDHKFMRLGGKTYRLFRWIETFINHRPAAILTSSRQVQEHLIAEFGVAPAKIRPLPDCVDLDRFDPDQFSRTQKEEVRRSLNIPIDSFLVVYLGLLTEYQGIHHLLQTAAILKQSGQNIHFLIMGFPNVDHYRQMAANLDVDSHVTFTGKLPYDLAPLYLSIGEIAITAKVSTTEGSGKLLNYMALGLPVVAYDTPVHREYLGEFGCYVPAGAVAELAAAVAALATNGEERERLGRGLAVRAANLFTWESAAEKIEEVYRSAGKN